MLSLSSLPSPGAERRRQQREAGLMPGSRVLPSSGVAFEPTSTARLDETMRELGAFSPHVRSAMETAHEHATAVEALAARLRAQMAVPLPRVWAPVDGSPSQCEPKSPGATHDYPSGRVGGGTVDDAAFVAAAEEAVRQLRVNVAGPLERWLDALDVAAARLESVERARLGFDAARREADERFAADERRAHLAFAALRDPTAAAAAVAATTGGGLGFEEASSDQYGRGLLGRRRRGGGGLFTSSHANPAAGAAALFGSGGLAGGGAASSAVAPVSARGALFVETAQAAELEETALRRAQHERALQAIRASYEEQERLAFEMLSGLARDTARLKSYYCASLLSAMHGCQRLALSLGAAKVPLPGFAPPGGAAASSADYGRIGSIEKDVLAASPLARELAQGRLPPTAAEAGAGVPAQAPSTAAGVTAAAAPTAAWPVVVRRAVATPMAVGADTTLEARARVVAPPRTKAAMTTTMGAGEGGGGFGGGGGFRAEEEAERVMAMTTPEPAAPVPAAPRRFSEAGGVRGAAAAEGMGETSASPAAAALLQRRPMAAAVQEEGEAMLEAAATTMAAPTTTTTMAAPEATTTAAAPTTEAATAPVAAQMQEQLQPQHEEEEFMEARSRTWTPASSLMGGLETAGGAVGEGGVGAGAAAPATTAVRELAGGGTVA
jgi:hypothetical protein